MSLKTRLDGRSRENSSFKIKNTEGVVLAEVSLLDDTSCTLEITTVEGLHIEKPNGFKSSPNTNSKEDEVCTKLGI